MLLFPSTGSPTSERPYVLPNLAPARGADGLEALERAAQWLALQRAAERSAAAAADLAGGLLAVAEGARRMREDAGLAVMVLVVDLVVALLDASACVLATVDAGEVRPRVARGLPADRVAALVSRWQEALTRPPTPPCPGYSDRPGDSATPCAGGETIRIFESQAPVALVYVGRGGRVLQDAERLLVCVLVRAARLALSQERRAADDGPRVERGQDAHPAGAPAAPPAVGGKPALSGLSPREREVLMLLAEGLSNQEIARRLFISPKTVKVHVSNILRKLRVPDRTRAALIGLRAKQE